MQASYEVSRRMQRRHDPTYYWATRRLPRETRPAVHALYGFVRGADELVDGPNRPAEPQGRRDALDRWEAELHRGIDDGRSEHPVIAALVDAGRRHDLPLEELRVYMRSMRVDCAPVRMRSYEELEAYMNGSAGAVGRIMAPLLGVPEEHHDGFRRLGLAFQLTNFIRDVPEDYALDRVYLPADDRERFGVQEADIAAGRATPGFRALLELQVQRARELFADTEPAAASARREVKPGMRLACSIYQRVLDRVERMDFDVLRGRAALPPWEMGRAAVRGLRPAA